MDDQQDRNLIALNERDVEDLERLVYAHRYEDAGRALVSILARMHGVFGARGYKAKPQVEHYLYTRLAAAVTALFADDGFTLLPNGFAALGLRQAIIAAIMEASAFEGSDHLIRLIGARDAQTPERVNFSSVQQQLKLLLTYSLDSDIDLDLESMFRQDPALMLSVYLGMLGRYVVLTPNAHRRHELLLRLGPLFEQVELRIEQVPALAAVWMNCMYGTDPDRHGVKRSLNVLGRRLLGPSVPPLKARARRPLADRPVMLVPLEHFRVPHVNYRTYAVLIRRLRERFTLVGAGTATDFDETSKAMFDRMIEFSPPDQHGFAPLLERLSAADADIVYYPTLGIEWWWVPLCTVRLAPIQIMTIGVPATTHSEAMDYAVVEESWAGEPDCYSETLVHTRTGSTRFEKRDMVVKRDAARAPHPDGAVRIAVASFVTKLNVPFMEACRRIEKQSRVQLEWHFFAGMSGLHHVVAKHQIRCWFPDAVIHRYTDYVAFMQTLARCDLHLSTFPFGGTNTNLDSMYLGIPMITLMGREAHSQIDAGMIRRAGLPEWLVAHTPDDYVKAALKLIHAPKERAKIARQLLKTPIDKIFTGSDPAASDDFVEAICWLYRNHEAIQGGGRKCWTVADREAQAPPSAAGAGMRKSTDRQRAARRLARK